jgi:sporulation protein YlmC with PRC-barrel domain
MKRDQLLDAHGATVFTEDGSSAGKVDDIYLDRDTDNPEWALINTGLFGTRSTFVPLAKASSEGNEIVVPYTKEQIKGAPSMDADGELS